MSCVERHNKFKQRYNEVWLSLVERCVRDAEVAGSNPVTSTNDEGIPYFKEFLFTLS